MGISNQVAIEFIARINRYRYFENILFCFGREEITCEYSRQYLHYSFHVLMCDDVEINMEV